MKDIGKNKQDLIKIIRIEDTGTMFVEKVKEIKKMLRYGIHNSEKNVLREKCKKRLKDIYGDSIPEIRMNRVNWELDAIERVGDEALYLLIINLFEELDVRPFEALIRGNHAASYVLHLCGVSPLDPFEYNLVPEFLYGNAGDVSTQFDITLPTDINLEAVEKTLAESNGVGKVIKRGIHYYLIPDYVSVEELRYEPKYSDSPNYLKFFLEKSDEEIEFPEIVFTVWEELELLKTLSRETATDVYGIDFHDKTNYGCMNELTECNREIVEKVHPKTFEEWLKISGWAHGTGIWEDNVELIFEEHDIDDLLSSRDDIYDDLLRYGIDKNEALKLALFIGKGRKGFAPKEWSKHMKKLKRQGIPEWYIGLCDNMVYSFPRAHLIQLVARKIILSYLKSNYGDLYDKYEKTIMALNYKQYTYQKRKNAEDL